ncbi:MAG TPA: winged helix DNA-binding protein [Bacteroidia bacterium]|nr:winged helix DNA-binding protein [Bacteroidia bacterium]
MDLKKYKLLSDLLPYLEDYERSSKSPHIKEFGLFLNNKLDKEPDKYASNKDLINDVSGDYRKFPKVEFAVKIASLFRFAKHYIKKAFKKNSFDSLDEFSLLATLYSQKEMNKMELINRHLMEFSSGSEMLKRLIKNGLISEKVDKNDKRARIVSLTSKGKKEIESAFKEMHLIAQIVAGKISDEEINYTLKVFNKLDWFHWEIYERDKDAELIEIFKKYIQEK